MRNWISGLSSLSKVVVLDRSERKDVDVDYTFYQIGVKNTSESRRGSHAVSRALSF